MRKIIQPFGRIAYAVRSRQSRISPRAASLRIPGAGQHFIELFFQAYAAG
jgi:hypothetical protein